MHVFRWDLDRTYLETQISSWRGLLRAAFETAEEKRTIPGAAALLSGLQAHDPSARVCVISGSPTQMREVLAKKLLLDGIRVDRLILKDNLGNLRRGRLRAIRAQIGYKLPHLLEDRLESPPEATETLFGDDSETDALIYTAYSGLLAGTLGEEVLLRLLEAGGAYPDAVTRARAALRALPRAQVVDDIFIRIDRGLPLSVYELLGTKVMPVFSWLQAALVLWVRGRLAVPGVARVAAACGPPETCAGWMVDAVRRRLITQDTARRLAAEPALARIGEICLPLLDRLAPPAALSPERDAPDLFAFLEATRR